MESGNEKFERGKEEIVSEVRDIVLDLYRVFPEQITQIYEELSAFAIKLQRKYPETHQQCRLWHLCFGSSEEGTFTDFTGEDSVELFVKNLAKRYLEGQK